ncbi:MAG: hypothetical protein V1720_12345 [bacterium]
MKVRILSLILFLFLITPATSNAQTIIDLGKCNLKIIENRERASFKDDDGEIIKPSRRDSRFIEIKVEGKAYTTGVSAWYPQMFAALFVYRGSVRVTPAIAVGIKFSDPLTGKREQWFHKEGVSYTAGCEDGQSIGTWVIVEIGKETTDFILQGPASIQNIKI